MRIFFSFWLIFFFFPMWIQAQISLKSAVAKYPPLKSAENLSAENILFSESFDLAQLPENWTDTVFSTEKTWIFQVLPDFPFSEIVSGDAASAICPYVNDTIGQNEWLITPIIELPAVAKTIQLDFYAGFSKTWLKNANLEVWLGDFLPTDTVWKKIWNAASYKDTLSSNFTWRKASASLTTYKGKNIKLGFRYVGEKGDLIALDHIIVSSFDKANEADILSFSLTNQLEEAVIDAQNKTISVKMIYGTDFSALVPTFTLSAGATASIQSGDTISLTSGEPFEIEVLAEDSVSKNTWKLTATEAEVAKEANIVSFSITGQTQPAIIDTKNAIIEAEISCTTNPDSLILTFETSKAATASIQSGDTMAVGILSPFPIVVQAQDTSVSRTWQLVVSVRDYTANIVSFSVPGQIGSAIIDTVQNTVFLQLPYGSKLDSLIPSFYAADCATSEPASGDTLRFENKVPKTILVYPKNTSLAPVKWNVTIQLQKNAIYTQGFDAKDSIPEGWNVHSESEKTWTFKHVPDYPFSAIYKPSKYSAFVPWAADGEEQDEWLMSAPISTQSFVDQGITDLKLGFYIGYNPYFSDGYCDLQVMVKTENSDWQLKWQLPSEEENPIEWTWRAKSVDFTSYLGQEIQLAFVYKGINGDLIALDEIQLYSDPTELLKIKDAQNYMKVFPNPASDYIMLEGDFLSDICLYDLSGRIVFQQKNIVPQSIIALPNLKKGLYLLKAVNQKGEISTQKLQIQ